MVIALWGQTSAQAPHATQFSAMIFGIFLTYSVLDCLGGALVYTGSAVNAFSGVDNGDIIYSYCSLGAHVGAGAACNTVVCYDLRHLFHLFLSSSPVDTGSLFVVSK